MIKFEQALEIVLSSAPPLREESVSLRASLDRVLAQDVRADRDMPQADLSAMDGYACRAEDAGRPMRIVETILAGQVPRHPIQPGECSRIMTGAILPEGADSVLMFEHAEEESEWVRAIHPLKKRNVRQKGEDGRQGDLLLHPGIVVSPAVMGLLASVGCDPVSVSRIPSVVVMATGDELVEPWCSPELGGIRNSNGYQLCSQLRRMGIEGRYEGIVPDRIEDLVARIRQVQGECDLILMSGGVSEGDRDLVPDAFQRCGYRLLFERVAMQPGKPTVFGTDERSFCCGLPGNPLSTFVVFELLLKPFLFAMQGHDYCPKLIEAVMSKTFKRRGADRQGAFPVVFSSPGEVTAIDYHGSAHLVAMCHADALLTLPIGVTEVKEGTRVHVRPL